MNGELLKYIRYLSITDRKNLAEKALKTAEEVGELAKVTLPYVSAFATNHRFVQKEQILEEAVDTILCALSVAYELGFADEEVESMMKLKAEKWAYLQQNEKEFKFPIPFEIHITVEVPNFQYGFELDTIVEQFRSTCKRLEVKPIILDLHTSNGEYIKDVMTSSTHFGSNTSAYGECRRIVDALHQGGYKVVREKIETVPWHPASPKRHQDRMPEHCYFEAHIPLIHKPENKENLYQFVKDTKMDVHISRNAFKKHADGTVTTMITYRTYDSTMEAFEKTVDKTVNMLTVNIDGVASWTVGKVHKEFSIYDTKVSHDAKWLKGG